MFSMIAAVSFGLATILYMLLALGFPLGEFAMGGKYKVLPIKFRIACAASVLIQLFAIMIVLQTGGNLPLLFSAKVTKSICYFFALYLSINVIMNLFSDSKKEKYISGILSIITAVCFWLTALGISI